MSINIYDWIDENHDQQLSIADVDNLKPGDKLDVCVFDRNFAEYGMWDKYTAFKGYDAEDILQFNRMTLHYKGNYTWDLIMPTTGTFEHPFHLCVEHLGTNWCWSVLNVDDAKIHMTNNIFKNGDEHDDWKPIHMHYDDFPKTTRVGWRGPIMLWENVSKMPQIHWHIRETNK